MGSEMCIRDSYELDKLYDEKWPSIVEVTLKDGRTLTARHDLPKGEPEFPCSPEDMRTKFFSLAGDALPQTKVEALWDAIMNLEQCKNVNELTAMLIRD